MTAWMKQAESREYGEGPLTVRIIGPTKDGKGTHVLDLKVDAVFLACVKRQALLDDKEGVSCVYAGDGNLSNFLTRAMAMVMVPARQLRPFLEQVIRHYPTDYYMTLSELEKDLLKENQSPPKGGTHDGNEGSD